jgi:hypothetical protein
LIKEQLQIITNNEIMQEVILAHIHPLMLDQRLPIVEEKITQILNIN